MDPSISDSFVLQTTQSYTSTTTTYTIPSCVVTRTYIEYNVTGSDSIRAMISPGYDGSEYTIPNAGAITTSDPGNLIGPVPSECALDVELIDPVLMFGLYITPDGTKLQARVFGATDKTFWIIGLTDPRADDRYLKMAALRVSIVNGSAYVKQFAARFVEQNPGTFSNELDANSAWIGGNPSDYQVANLTARIYRCG
jgi:hypothetical protein